MEACSGAHYWAREFSQFGHTVKLMAPKFVAPYRMSGKRGKNDAADAAAICEAVTRPNMRFVPVKDVDQQAILCLHRTRQGFIEERTALYNRLRGLISEFGIVLPQKVERLRREIGAHLEALPGWKIWGRFPVDRSHRLIDQKSVSRREFTGQPVAEHQRSTASVDVKRVGPAWGEPDYLQERKRLSAND